MSSLVERQPNEEGPKIMKATQKQSRCFCCKQKIEPGQEYFYLPMSLYDQRRHTTCARKTPGRAARRTTIRTYSDGFDKRRRGNNGAGGDGWTHVG
jgi:hypothetical protein